MNSTQIMTNSLTTTTTTISACKTTVSRSNYISLKEEKRKSSLNGNNVITTISSTSTVKLKRQHMKKPDMSTITTAAPKSQLTTINTSPPTTVSSSEMTFITKTSTSSSSVKRLSELTAKMPSQQSKYAPPTAGPYCLKCQRRQIEMSEVSQISNEENYNPISNNYCLCGNSRQLRLCHFSQKHQMRHMANDSCHKTALSLSERKFLFSSSQHPTSNLSNEDDTLATICCSSCQFLSKTTSLASLPSSLVKRSSPSLSATEDELPYVLNFNHKHCCDAAALSSCCCCCCCTVPCCCCCSCSSVKDYAAFTTKRKQPHINKISSSSSSSPNVVSASLLLALRTFQYLMVFLQTNILGRPRRPLIKQLKRPETTRLKRNSKIRMPKYPVVLMFLIALFLSFLLPSTTALAEVKLQRNETVCKSIDIRNSPTEFKNLTNCTVIEGFLLMTLIDRVNHSDYVHTFPLLKEVTEYVIIYRVNGLRTLADMFPNLSVIRGKTLFEGFALVIYQNTHMEEIGLKSLTTISRGAVRIEKNPALCFVETIDWSQIGVSSDLDFFGENKPKRECRQCPGDSDKSRPEGVTETGEVICPLHQGERHCWNSRTCQRICPPSCKDNCNENLKCCNPGCLGGCSRDNPNSCTTCRHLAKMDICIDKCPHDYFSYLDRSCVTAETCTRRIGTKFEGSKQETLIPFNGVCSVRCPEGYNKINSKCEKCMGKCVKKCVGGLIDSVGAARQMHGCTHIIKEPLFISIKRGGRHLMEDLEFGLSAIVEIDTYLKVQRTFGMVSLAYLKNLERIKGEKLESDTFVLYVVDNANLENIWGPKQTVKMDEGRVYFHFNPKLCYSVIDSLRPSLKNSTYFDKNEVSADSNGSKGSCFTEVLELSIGGTTSGTAYIIIENPMRFEDERTFIGYQYFYTEDPYRNVSLFSHKQCDDRWTSTDPTKDAHYLITYLKPYTQYAYYVKTYTISSEPRNGQSPIQYFRTKSDQPKLVQNMKAIANSTSAIIVHWMPPAVINGNLTHYIIRATLDINESEQLKTRNFCKDPLKDGPNIDVPSSVMLSKSETTGTIAQNGDCKCDKNVTRKDGKQPQIEEAMYENIIDFENNLQNFVYVKQTNETSSSSKSSEVLISRRRRRRTIDNGLEALHRFTNGIITSTMIPAAAAAAGAAAAASNSTNATVPVDDTSPEDMKPRFDKTGLYYEYIFNRVNSSVTQFVLAKLKHFSLYTISVKACREPEVGAPKNNCSPESIAYARTQKKDDVDKIRNLQAELENTNTSRSNLRLKWDPPEEPNSITVSYTITYISNAQDAVAERKCIAAADFQNFTNGYVLSGLPTGNYSITVRANSLAGDGIESEPVYKYIPPTQISPEVIIIICVSLLFLLLLIIGVVYYLRKKILAPPSDLKIFPTVNPYYISLQYIPDEWEVPRDKVIQLGALGQGSFGMVYEGILKNFNNSTEDTPCAIKTVNENATDRERMNFLNEASVMKQFDTYHVVRLMGVCSRGQPALVLMELMKNGDLKTYLRLHRNDDRGDEPLRLDELPLQPPPLSRILQMAIEIADGMAYLAAKKYVHRDLAARNCMVAADLTVKIGDFGMTRDIYETDYYRKGTKGLLPVRWMPPESLKDGVYSTASDVFSYGVVLWEMSTLASQPYPGYSNDQVLRYVIDGGVMERPENCPDKLYKLMQKCWHHRPSARPSFMEIIRFLFDTADPHFREVSFYHSEEASAIRNHMQEEHDMDDVTTPLRVGEYEYKLNIDNNSSVEQHESPMAIDDDHPHSPYSLGSAILISSTPGAQSKNSFNLSPSLHQINPTLSLPSTSAAAGLLTHRGGPGDSQNRHHFPDHTDAGTLYVQPDIEEFSEFLTDEVPQRSSCDNVPTTANAAAANSDPNTSTQLFLPSVASSASSSKYPSSSLKKAVAETVQNVSNSLVPSRIRNMEFLRNRRFFNHKRSDSNASSNKSGAGGGGGSSTLNPPNNSNSNSNLSSSNSGVVGAASSGNIECGAPTRSFFASLTPSHTSDNPNYQLLNESLNMSALSRGATDPTSVGEYHSGGNDDDDDLDNHQRHQPSEDGNRRTIAAEIADNRLRNQYHNQETDDDDDDDEDDCGGSNTALDSHERIPLSRRKSNSNKPNRNRQRSRSRSNRTSPSASFNVTRGGVQWQTNSPANDTIIEQCNLSRANSSCSYSRETPSGGGDDDDESQSQSLAPKKSSYHLKETWLNQRQQPPNGFIGREG